MRATVIQLLVLVLSVLFVAPLGASRGETIKDEKLRFTLELPAMFVPRPDLVGATPDVIHAFQIATEKEGEPPVLLVIERLGGVISREPFSKERIPLGLDAQIFVATWQGFELDAVAAVEDVQGTIGTTLSVQIPLRPQAIQVKLFGPAGREPSLRALFGDVLAGLRGETNWLPSEARRPQVRPLPERERWTLLGLSIGGIVVGLLMLRKVSKSRPGGTVLAIAAALFFVSFAIKDQGTIEGRLLCSTLRLIGFGGGILGIVDLVLGRRPRDAVVIPADSPKDPGG